MGTDNSMIVSSRKEKYRQKNPKKIKLKSYKLWIFIWLIFSILPILPLTASLWQDALADTPYAYLIWIPVFGFLWAAWAISRVSRYQDDAELNSIMSIPVLIIAVAVFIAAVKNNPGIYIGQDIGILFWPLWSIALAWMIFGIGITKAIIKPMLYLLLAWSPLYVGIVNFTTPPLLSIANNGLLQFAKTVNYIQTLHTYGNYLVETAGSWYAVQVSSLCSGADSFLAILIMLPVIFVFFHGTWFRKAFLIIVALVLTVFMNILRLILLTISLHYWGVNFTFGELHPVIGFILFLLSIGIIAMIGKLLGFRGIPSKHQANAKNPGILRFSIVSISTIIVTIGLWPLYFWVQGSFSNPITVPSNELATLMPNLKGFHRALLGVFPEAAILGPGAYGTAYAYSNATGDYAMGEEWWSNNLNTLLSYGVNNCLLFHGNTIIGNTSFTVRPGITAHAYAILLPPSSTSGGNQDFFEDVSYTFAVKYNGNPAYIRAEFATPIQYQISPSAKILQSTAIQQLLNAQFHGMDQSSGYQYLTSGQVKSANHFVAFIHNFANLQMS